MKFIAFKEFRQLIPSSIEEINAYLSTDLSKTLRELALGLSKLTFGENFESFEVTVIIPATSEIAIRNQLQGRIPSKRLIVRSNSADIVDGDTAWSMNFVYLKNLGASSASVTVVFLR